MAYLNRMIFSVVLIAVSIELAGCGGSGKEPPKLYPVSGKVVYRDNNPVPGGSIEFVPLKQIEDAGSAFGTIKADGSFDMMISFEMTQLKGVPQGEYKVMIMAGDGTSQEQFEDPPIELPKTYTVNAEGENTFIFKINKKK